MCSTAHVGLDLDCVDGLYLNAYVPKLQVGGQVVTFLTEHLGFPIPSPALLEKIGNRFRREVKAFAEQHQIPIFTLKEPNRARWDDRTLDPSIPTWSGPKPTPLSRSRSSSGCSARRTARARLAS